MSHTPGPWEAHNVVGAGWEIKAKVPQLPGVDKPVTIYRARGSDEYQTIAYAPWVQFPKDYVEDMFAANSRLIAAAPELLEACKAAYGAFQRNDAIDWNILDMAILKAEKKHDCNEIVIQCEKKMGVDILGCSICGHEEKVKHSENYDHSKLPEESCFPTAEQMKTAKAVQWFSGTCSAHRITDCRTCSTETEKTKMTPEDQAHIDQHSKRHPRPEIGWHWTDTRLHCYRELGYALVYMKYLHPDWDRKQVKRVKQLCREAAALRMFTNQEMPAADQHNQIAWMQLYNKIQDEIENMC